MADQKVPFTGISPGAADGSPNIDPWMAAFNVACRTCELFPPDTPKSAHRFGAETVARALLKEMEARGIEVFWPAWLQYQEGETDAH